MEIAQIARVLLTTSGLILGTGVAEAQQAKIPRVGLLVLGGPAPTIVRNGHTDCPSSAEVEDH